MLAFYKEKKYYLISLIALLLDGIILYFKPMYYHDITFLYPMLTISLLPFLLDEDFKAYQKYCFVLGFIYDLLYSNIFLYHAIIFCLLSYINLKGMKLFKNNLLFFLFLTLINIILYDIIGFCLVNITGYQQIGLEGLFYKIKNSLMISILSSFIYYFLCKKEFSRHKM